MVNLVLEFFGAKSDSTVTLAGYGELTPDSLIATDADFSITGGTGMFLGATGACIFPPHPTPVINITAAWRLYDIWVPKL